MKERHRRLLFFAAGLAFFGTAGITLRVHWLKTDSSQTNTAEHPSPESNVTSDSIIFAGLSGHPPLWFDSGPNIGTGWVEYQTKELLQGMSADGFRLQQEWMSPARIAHEFRVGNPICTFPHEWNDPKTTFSQKPDRIYSIALDFEEEEGRSVIFNTSDFTRFKPFFDQKGDLEINQLLENRTLKIALIRDKNYGRFTRMLTEINDAGDQMVRPQYRDHVYLMVIRENRQLIEMLNAHRFDYIFSDAIEEQDLQTAGLSRDLFTRVNFQTSSIESLEDPKLNQVSVVCSIHPKTLEAMPYINKWISLTRGAEWRREKLYYKKKLDLKFARTTVQPTYAYVSGRFGPQLRNGSADTWYPLQEKYFPSLKRFPPTASVRSLPPLPKSAQPLLWYGLVEADGTFVLLSGADFYHRSILDSTNEEKDIYQVNPTVPWDHRNLDPLLPKAVRKRLFQFDFQKEAPGHNNVRSVQFGAARNLIIFAGSMTRKDLEFILPQVESPLTQSLTVFDAQGGIAPTLVDHLSKSLIELNLINSSLREGNLPSKILSLKNLRKINLSATQLGQGELEDLLKNLPDQMLQISLGFNPQSFSLKAAKTFGNRPWRDLLELDLSCNSLDSSHLTLMKTGIPSTIERLGLGGNFFDPQTLRALFDRGFPSLRELALMSTEYDTNEAHFSLPQSLRSFQTFISPFHSAILSRPKLAGEESPRRLRHLDLAWSEAIFRNKNLPSIFSQLDSDLIYLNLAQSGVTTEMLTVLVNQEQVKHIERLDLSGNSLTDEAIEVLARAKFSISYLNLDNNLIHDRGAGIIAKTWGKNLKALNLSLNPITRNGTTLISEQLSPQLERLELASLFSLDVANLSMHLPAKLKVLNLANNGLNDQDLAVLVPRLPRGLYDLNLSGSAFGPVGARWLAEFMPENLADLNIMRIPLEGPGLAILSSRLPPSLSKLAVGNLSLDSASARAFALAIPPRLRVLQIESIQWSRESADTFASHLPFTLQSLLLSGVPLWPDGARALSAHWPSQLITLRLEGAELGDPGLIALSRNLPTTIQKLELSSNQITDLGLSVLANQPLEKCTTLDLSSNLFTKKGLLALAAKPRNFKALYFTSCHLAPEAIEALDSKLLESVRRLHLSNNKLSDQSVVSLLKRLSPNTFKLYLNSVSLSYEAVDSFISALPPNLQRLAIAGNQLGEKGIHKLEEYAARPSKPGPRLELIK